MRASWRGWPVPALLAAGLLGLAAPAAPQPTTVTYRAVPLFGSASLRALRLRLGPEAYGEVLRLNRVDAARAAALDTLIVPEPAAGFVAPSPFPARAPALDSLEKALVVSLRVQAFAAYDSGRLARWGPVSSGGRNAPTLAGLYHVNWKLPVHTSSFDSTWVMPWTVNIDNHEGTALHEFELPGRPASHCCIRLAAGDARWVYDWVEPWRLDVREETVLACGTPVFLMGRWDFDAPPPWRRLPVDAGAARVPERELAEALRAALAGGPEKQP